MNEWQQSPSDVIFWEHLKIFSSSLISPLPHLIKTTQIESDTHQRETCHNIEEDPSHNFTEVVWCCDIIEEESLWDFPFLRSWCSQSLEHDVAVTIRDDRSDHTDQTNDCQESEVSSWEEVDVDGDSNSKAIVICAVLEDVSDWHCHVTELVDIDCLEDSLDIVDDPHDKSECCLAADFLFDCSSKLCNEVDDDVEEEWAKVLCQVDKSEWELLAEIFHLDDCLGCDTTGFEGLVDFENNLLVFVLVPQSLSAGFELGLFLNGKSQCSNLLGWFDVDCVVLSFVFDC